MIHGVLKTNSRAKWKEAMADHKKAFELDAKCLELSTTMAIFFGKREPISSTTDRPKRRGVRGATPTRKIKPLSLKLSKYSRTLAQQRSR